MQNNYSRHFCVKKLFKNIELKKNQFIKNLKNKISLLFFYLIKKIYLNLEFFKSLFFFSLFLLFLCLFCCDFRSIAFVGSNFSLQCISWTYLITLLIFGTIIGWRFIFSIINQPSSLKQKLADGYIILLVSVLNHEQLPIRFILFTVSLGSFLGRRLILFMSIPYPKSLLIIFFFPFLFFYLSFILVYGYFVLCVQYPKLFGNSLISFFEKNASREVLRLIHPLKKELTMDNKKLVFKKHTKIRKHKLKRFHFKKRKYLTTRKVSGVYKTN